ncbi:MAG TPA: CPBP family intramembrane glutamic endopeptidase [Chloroflexota bacterium]|jgi:membrane protease YdiL (CAAX protease family)|nr:CPBP family intramembrane glutamic endopeptidase [Chloroflexota bacterium]
MLHDPPASLTAPAALGAAPAAPGRVPVRGVALFLAVSCAVAWGAFGLIVILGGLARPAAGLLLLLAMYGPALGTLAARVWGEQPPPLLGVRRRGGWWPYLIAWLGPPLALLLGAALAAGVGVQPFDPTLSRLRQTLEQQGGAVVPPPGAATIALVASLMLVGALLNSLATFGEEVGWRGYLLAALAPLGGRRAALLVGLVWGLWHVPLIVQGWNYPGQPVLGSLLMVLFALTWAVVFAWLRLWSGSVWPAVLGHGAINAAGSSLLALFPMDNPLLGAPVGLVVQVPGMLWAVWLLRSPVWDAAPRLSAPRA